jgi:hypothetical protein
MEKRHGMAFSVEDKQSVRERAQGGCEFPPGCERPNTNKVNHLTGVFEAFLDNKDKRAIKDPNLNAVMLCEPHEVLHDAQEAFQVQSLLGERHHQRRRMFITQRRRR